MAQAQDEHVMIFSCQLLHNISSDPERLCSFFREISLLLLFQKERELDVEENERGRFREKLKMIAEFTSPRCRKVGERATLSRRTNLELPFAKKRKTLAESREALEHGSCASSTSCGFSFPYA